MAVEASRVGPMGGGRVSRRAASWSTEMEFAIDFNPIPPGLRSIASAQKQLPVLSKIWTSHCNTSVDAASKTNILSSDKVARSGDSNPAYYVPKFLHVARPTPSRKQLRRIGGK